MFLFYFVINSDFEIETYANKTLLFKFLLSHNMHAETMRLLDCILKELRMNRQHPQCQVILHSLTSQLHYCGSYLRDKIITCLLRWVKTFPFLFSYDISPYGFV